MPTPPIAGLLATFQILAAQACQFGEDLIQFRLGKNDQRSQVRFGGEYFDRRE